MELLDLRKEAEALSIPPSKKEPSEEKIKEYKRNYYDILGIRHDATPEQIKIVYKKLALIYHPDQGKHFGVNGEWRFREIKEAYETLIDPDKRKEYDRKLGA